MSDLITEIQEQYVKLLYLFEHGGEIGLRGAKAPNTSPFPAAWKRDLGVVPVYVLDDAMCRAILHESMMEITDDHRAHLVFSHRGEWLIVTTPHQWWLHVIIPDDGNASATIRFIYCRDTTHCILWPFDYTVTGTSQRFEWTDFGLSKPAFAALQRRFTQQDMFDLGDIAGAALAGLSAVLTHQPEIIEQPWKPRSMADMISRSRVAKGRPALINIRTLDLDAPRRITPDQPPRHEGHGIGGEKSPHDRIGHPRVLHRGTERERTIMIPPIKVKGGTMGTITVVKASKHQTP